MGSRDVGGKYQGVGAGSILKKKFGNVLGQDLQSEQ